MRKYALPLVICTAIGAVIVVLVKMREEDRTPSPVIATGDTGPAEPQRPTSLLKPRPKTRTTLGQNFWMSELERALARDDLSKALEYRGRICEELDDILESDLLRRNLFADIRDALAKDKKRRDVVLPMLRVIRDSEATAIIQDEFYKCTDPEERMTLLEAMAHKYHDPEVASQWAVDAALNSEDAEHRERAFSVIADFSEDPEIKFRTAKAIYDGTTRPKQSEAMMQAVSQLGYEVEAARTFMRGRLNNPHPGEVHEIASRMDSWGNERDAVHLEALAMEFPAMGDELRECAERIRHAVREKNRLPHQDPTPPSSSDDPR